MLFFLYGPDDFRRRERLNEYIAAHREKNKTSFSLVRLAASDEDFLSNFANETDSQSLFGGKKLIVAQDIFGSQKDVREKIQSALEARIDYFRGEEIFLFFAAAETDKREKLFKFLAAEARVEIFDNLKGHLLEKWVLDRAKKKGIKIKREAVGALVGLVGGDSARLEEELEKLSLFLPAGKISPADIAEVVLGSGFNFFGLLDAFSSGDKKTFLLKLTEAMSAGENLVGLAASLANQARILLLASHFRSGGKSARDLASRAGVHPYVAEKAMGFVKNKNVEELENLFLKLALADKEIKTGRADPASALAAIFAK